MKTDQRITQSRKCEQEMKISLATGETAKTLDIFTKYFVLAFVSGMMIPTGIFLSLLTMNLLYAIFTVLGFVGLFMTFLLSSKPILALQNFRGVIRE